MKARTRPLVLLLICVISLSCSDDNKSTGPDPATPFPHARPAPATMRIDASDLAEEGPIDRSGGCHRRSHEIVLWIDAVLVFPFAIPVGAFSACLLRDPVYAGNETWQWMATGGAGGLEHTDELTARLLGDGKVEWAMHISGTQYDLDRFLWFDGICDTAATEGVWRFYDRASPRTPREMLRIEWTLDDMPGGNTTLLLDVTDEESDHFGDRLRSESSATHAALSFRDFVEGESDSTLFHRDWLTGSGMAISAAGDTCCWGERPDYVDVRCP